MIEPGQPITIIGAGIAGLAVARALAMRGASVVVLEQAAMIRDIGAGIQISPNGAAVINALGLGEVLSKISLRAAAVSLRDGLTDRPVLRMDLSRDPTRRGFHLVHRADLISALLDGAVMAGVEMRLNHGIDSVDIAAKSPVLHLRTARPTRHR